MFRIALAQVNPVVGDLRGNADRILDFARRAAEKGADLVCFPELALTGYPPEDLVFRRSFVEDNLAELDRLAREAPGLALVVGYVDRGAGEDRRARNSAALIQGQRVTARYHKILLPNYDVFDEQRYFEPGDACPVVDVGGVPIGLMVCEDIWFREGPAREQAMSGARVLVNLNASPYSVGKRELRERMLVRRALENGVFISYTNMVGGQDELIFDGGSLVFGPDGRMLARAPQFEEALLLADLDVSDAARAAGGARATAPPDVVPTAAITVASRRPLGYDVAPTLEVEEEVYGALVLAVRDYVRKNGFKDVVIGLSGGIDSSLVATIAADALGAAHVLGVMMPSRYSSEGSVSDAESLARALGIRTEMIPIEAPFAATMELLEKLLGEGAHGLTEENLQARIRGNLLMAISNARGSLVLTTGNKSEMSTGYSTLYGDMAGGFAVIKDIEKTLVFRLCSWRNDRGERDVIPRWVIAKPPSAELRPNQRDTDSLPPYAVLDPILRGYVEEDLPVEEIAARGFDAPLVRRVMEMVDRNEYKRRQAPPGPRITHRGLGKDRRMPITSKYRER
ncbi:MAG: NAD+ synthase [Candidatus Eisenbacteria bacterium]|nr:NAD+ synthase [Candidatus Eisenbacteria bacterium]